MARLVVASGPDRGKEFDLGDRETVGRSKPATIVITDTKMSRQHARLVRRGDGFLLADLNSSNGTFVNGQRTTRSELKDGDRVVFGSTEVAFENRVEKPAAPDSPDIDWGDDDEIAFLNQREAAIAPADPVPIPAVTPTARSEVRHRDKTLQYSKYARSGDAGALGEDIDQRGGFGRVAIYGAVILGGAALFYGVWKITQSMFGEN